MTTARGMLNIPGDPTPWVITEPENASREFAVLWLQGWKSTIDGHLDRIERLAKTTSVTFAMCEYAGHGSHLVALEDSAHQQQFGEALATYDELVTRGYQKIIVIGSSFGAYLTALLSAERSPYGLVLRVPAIYDDSEFAMSLAERAAHSEQYAAFKRTVTADSNLAALGAIKNFDGSVYVIEQEIDSVIPKNIPQSYFHAAKRGNYLVVPDTEHSPNMQDNPDVRYDYIEHLLVSIVRSFQLEAKIK